MHAVVEFDYQAQHDDELTIAVGDIISNIRKDEGGWWEGEVAGRRGLFPDNFVREIKKEVRKDVSLASQTTGLKSDMSNGSASPASESSLRPAKKGEAIRKRRCKAAFSYMPQNDDELELKIGDVIEVLCEVEEGWWEGYLNGRTGMFPSNFTKGLTADDEDPDSTGSESDGGDSSSVRSDGGSMASSTEIQPKKVRGFGFGDIFKDQPIKLRPRSMDMENELEKTAKKAAPAVAQETMKTEPDSKSKGKEFCKVLFQYDAQNEDELSIKEGDIVTIISKECADAGWWLGELNGKQGVFPDNFVKLFIPETEKEVRPHVSSTHCCWESCWLHMSLKASISGEEIKLAEIQKPALPAVPPKKPLPPKNNNSLSRPSSLPPKRPERPERPHLFTSTFTWWHRGEVPVIVSHVFLCVLSHVRACVSLLGGEDVDDFDSIISSTEKLNHPTASRPRVMDRRPRSQIFASSSLSSPDLLESSSLEEEKREREKGKEEQDSFTPKSLDSSRKMSKAVLRVCSPQTPDKSSLPPKPLTHSVSSGPGGASLLPAQAGSATLRPHSPSMEGRGKGEQEKGQLVRELDEEKKIRLSLQVSGGQHHLSDAHARRPRTRLWFLHTFVRQSCIIGFEVAGMRK
uniref:Osteoclast-stimulating factor 1 n=1 Tax=Electrophorus electricus TaxID=8005 RepID=A0A4W4HEA4_ELEEL